MTPEQRVAIKEAVDTVAAYDAKWRRPLLLWELFACALAGLTGLLWNMYGAWIALCGIPVAMALNLVPWALVGRGRERRARVARALINEVQSRAFIDELQGQRRGDA